MEQLMKQMETGNNEVGMYKNFVRFGDLFDYENKSKIKAGEGLAVGEYPFYTSSSVLSKFLDDYTFDKTSLIFGTGGNASIHYCESPFSVSTDCLVVFAKDETICFPKFVFYYLFGNINLLEEGFKGAGLKHISKGFINDLGIPLPPLPIQKRIAEILDAADALKRKDQELLKKYDELAQAIFIDMFGDPVKNEKGWEVKRLDELLLKGEKISYGVVQPGDDFPNGVPIVRVGDFKLMKIDKTNLKKINPEIETTYNKTRLKGDEILIACVGSVGKIALADESLKGFNIVRATAKVRVDHNIINRTYLAFHLSQISIQNYFIAETRTSSQPTLNIKQIEETKILVPPIRIQNQFNLLSTDLLKQIEMVNDSNSDGLFQVLIQKAFKGELVA